jgi:hypothetical protein
MITIEYSNGRKNAEVVMPEEFNDLTGDQLIKLASLKMTGAPKDVAELKALRILLNISEYAFFKISNDIKYRMLQFAEWVWKENTLTKQVLPECYGFYGFKGEFDNLTLGEFHFSEIYYNQLVNGETEEEKEEGLNNLVATLYRKPKEDYDTELDSEGDIRIPFNSNETAYYAQTIQFWPPSVKLAIVYIYDGCRQHLINLYDKVFKGSGGDENNDGMFGIIRGLSGDKYGEFDKVERLNIHTALLEIEYQIKEAEELEKANK